MQWFVEERNTFGGWSPSIYHGDRPDPKGSERKKVWRSEPVPVPEVLIGREIKQIAACLSPDGEFAGVDLDAVAAFLKDGISDVLTGNGPRDA